MSLSRRYRTDPFTDLLFNALLGFTLLFLTALMLINPKARSGIIDPKAEYIVTISWKDYSPDDIDLWMEDPNGELVWFRSREVGLTHMDRDDRGMLNDNIIINNKKLLNPLNQEIVTIRGIVPGEYVVNVHYYQTETKKPVDVQIRLDKLNPKLEVVYYGTVRLEKAGEEKTAFRFRVNPDGSIREVSFLPKNLVILEERG